VEFVFSLSALTLLHSQKLCRYTFLSSTQPSFTNPLYHPRIDGLLGGSFPYLGQNIRSPFRVDKSSRKPYIKKAFRFLKLFCCADECNSAWGPESTGDTVLKFSKSNFPPDFNNTLKIF
jgi:hypothetical protein